MLRLDRGRWKRLIAVPLVAAIVAVLLVPGPHQVAASPPAGLECLTSRDNAFDLTATGGYVAMPDGNTIYMWSYAPSGGEFQLPGPTICVASGVKVTVVLHNTLPEPTSVTFPGQVQVLADGQPAQPESDTSGNLTSLTTTAAAGNGSVTYTFTAGPPGTYLYQSGTDVQKQVQMGLYGALVVRPPGHPDRENGRADSAFDPDHEYLYLLGEIDPDLHLAVERRRAYDFTRYKARYFTINGRSMPDTLAPNHADWLPDQPYGALIHIQPYDPTSNPKPALIRYLNAGSVSYPFHPHGSDEQLIARDGRPAQGPGGQDLSFSNFLIDVAPGQTVDTLMVWKDAEHWNPSTNPIPVPLPSLQDQIVGPGPETWFAENPYLGGEQGELPPGVVQNNQCGEYYHVAHSHALEQATNYGASFGGMMTLIRIDPPAGCPA
ncbi:multicopper oxidase domain-containing protein [Micromonospora eburnea]|uniref:Multicopper oxidase n=1 Tax=Micromonospora eburnea TaxID=227316 RepID=A0A1C6UF82_9ACTN|nr:multicopper oxidase domain-containing protein [Micromonospora eburnea]SCL52601.1 Multicopper oxidase [Micromonospora eburnea]